MSSRASRVKCIASSRRVKRGEGRVGPRPLAALFEGVSHTTNLLNDTRGKRGRHFPLAGEQ